MSLKELWERWHRNSGWWLLVAFAYFVGWLAGVATPL